MPDPIVAKVIWTVEAETWLEEIFNYLSAKNSAAACRVVEGIYNRAEELKRFPRLGYRYERPTEREIRVLLFGHYRIAYWVRPDDDVVILGIFHGAMDIGKYLR